MRSIRARLGQLLPQPCVGAGLSALALLSLSASWLSWLRQPGPPSVMALLMAHHWGDVAMPSPALLGVAVVLATIDTVSFPLVLAPICGERPLQVMVASARDAAVPEGMQYVVGLLGALAAAQHPWALGLLV